MAAAETVAKVINPKNSASEVMDIYNDWATKYDEVSVQFGKTSFLGTFLDVFQTSFSSQAKKQ